MRITRIRVVVQVVSVAVFALLVFVTDFARLKGFPASLYLELDPLVAIASTIASHKLYQALVWSLVILLPTLFLGRFFCNWLCPMGALLQFTGWLGKRGKAARERIDGNRYRPLFRLKYALLAFILVAAAFGTLQNGLLDPIPTLHRSLSVAVLPVVGKSLYVRPHLHQFTWLIGLLFVFILGMSLVVPRFFCRALCPLGGLLGVFSRFSIGRIERDTSRCNGCEQCLRACEGAADPHNALRKSECMVCLNCLDDCPQGALSFAWLSAAQRPEAAAAVTDADVNRRSLALGAVMGALYYGFSRASGDTSTNFRPEVIRPPGSVAEDEFLRRCIKCDQCVRVCPTNVLQPAMLEAGLEGLWTPVMNMRLGYCELNCTLCGQVCPTGAIQKISIAEKLGQEPYADLGPVTTGTAFYDRGRCLPWAMDTPCVVCQEVCPVSPKAIYTREHRTTDRYGKAVVLQRPYVDPNRCIGCGICEHECPVADRRAIRITAVGESRSKERSLLLQKTPAGSSAAGNALPADTNE